jgi:AraC-like DNA-binding protein
VLDGEDEFYREHPPPADLVEVVACTWIRVSTQRRDALPIPIIPDGCADVIAYDSGEPIVVGPDAVTRWVEPHDRFVITGLRLRPGVVRTVLGCPATELLGRAVMLDDLSPERSCKGEIGDASSPQTRLAVLERWARRRVEVARHPDRGVAAACETLLRRPSVTMDTIAAELGWNARMLHRAFVAACGYGPKHLQRILRVQRAIRAALADARGASLAAVASLAGFADQSHMTRDFRDITGFSPTAYLALAGARVGRWIDEDWEVGQPAHSSLLSESFKTARVA